MHQGFKGERVFSAIESRNRWKPSHSHLYMFKGAVVLFGEGSTCVREHCMLKMFMSQNQCTQMYLLKPFALVCVWE